MPRSTRRMAGRSLVGVRSPLRRAPAALVARISRFRGTQLCPRRRFKRQIRLRGHSPCPGSYFMDVFRLRGHTVVDQKPHDSAIFAKPHDFAQNRGVPPQPELSRFSAAGAHRQGALCLSLFTNARQHRLNGTQSKKQKAPTKSRCLIVPPTRLERATDGLEGRGSIH